MHSEQSAISLSWWVCAFPPGPALNRWGPELSLTQPSLRSQLAIMITSSNSLPSRERGAQSLRRRSTPAVAFQPANAAGRSHSCIGPWANSFTLTAGAESGSHILDGPIRRAASAAVIKYEPESKPDKHRARRPVGRLSYVRPTQPQRKRTSRKGKQTEPEDTFSRVNGRKQHAEPDHGDSGGNELRQERNVENANFRIEKVG